MQTTINLTTEIRDASRQLASLGGQKLLQLTLDAVQAVPETELRAAAPGLAPFRPQMVLTLLTWSYASGHYSSQDIVWAMNREGSMARYLCAGTRPGWRVLRRFRREYRPWIEQCLAQVLKQAWLVQAKDHDWTFRLPGQLEQELSVQVTGETRARLDLAAIIDGAESE